LQPVFYPSPSIGRPVSNLTEEEQIKIAKRIGLIQHLPMGSYDGCQKKSRECVICMNEFTVGESLRYLPCMHKYHVACVDGKFAINLSVPCKFLYIFIFDRLAVAQQRYDVP
jgi:E3 ubiquitin-protein ligase RNF11